MIGRIATRGVGSFLLAIATGQVSPADPLVGRWELNVARTHYGGGATPRTRESFVCVRVTTGIQCTIHSVLADGQNVHGGFTAAYDGPSAATFGIPDVDHIQLTRVSDTIADATFTAQGNAVFGYRAVRATNGRSLTIIAVDPTTRAVLNSVVVYDRHR